MTRLVIIFSIVTGYCNDSCDKTPSHPAYGVMASGKATYSRAIACPSWMPLGTTVFLKGKRYTCEDRGGAIRKNRLDIWFPTCEEALEWGRRKMKAKIFWSLGRRI